ncbi:TAXI family TRAP transporter solute-binding subunit [Polynucleobacter sp. MWH-UH23A]|uniref:TAXI family TRAP transporter solute-binding subunit n=1 Tax=Polynucleobacter sp. MWH-UH23A TaxID=1855613 RepID=UPI003364CBCD
MKFGAKTQSDEIKHYFKHFFAKEKKGWIKLVLFFNIYIPLLIIGLITLILYVNPLPPKTAYLAVGQDGSSSQEIAKSFQTYFQKNGINLELVGTNGLTAGLKGLYSDESKINASFLTVGSATEEEYPGLVSLGSVQFAPIWIFYKGGAPTGSDPFKYLQGKKISIGTPGTATNILFQKLNKVSIKTPISNDLLELPHKEGAELLKQGKIDALFIVDSTQSETIKHLLSDASIKIADFSLADAYLKKLPFLQKLVIPKGSRSIENVDPPHDITILASTTNLLVEKNSHRAIQWGFILAAKEYSRTAGTFFSDPGFFPRDIDNNFPLSPIAEHYYRDGTPSLFGYLPIWIASLLDSIWIYILAFFALILPAFKLLNSLRLFPSEGLMEKYFVETRILDEAVLAANTKEQLLEVIKEINAQELRIYDMYLFGKNARFYFNQKNAINSVRSSANSKLIAFENESKSAST